MKLQEEIIRLMRDQDERGMELLYDHYSYSLFAIANSIVKDQLLAEDVLQKSFMKIWKNISKYDESKGALFTWLSTITRNTALDLHQSKYYSQKQSTETLENTYNKSSDLSISTDKIDVMKLIEELEPKYKLVLDYIYLQGYTQQQVSDAKGIPIGTIKTRLRKAIEIVRKHLGDEITFLLMGVFINLLNQPL